jgi:hypothetical protein
MATYTVTGPDGNTYNIDGPEGATEEQILQAAQELLGPRFADLEPEAEPEYEGFMQEVAEGVVSGGLGIVQGGAELLAAGIDIALDTDLNERVTNMYEGIRKDLGVDPTGVAGTAAEIVTQFAVPGLGAASAVSKAKALANSSNIVKSLAGVGAAGVVDAVVATDGTTTLGDFFEGGPTQTTDLIGLEGRERAMASIGNKLKVGLEAAGATALLEPALKGLGVAGGVAIKASTPIASPVAKQILRGGTALSSATRQLGDNIFGADRFDQFLAMFRSRGNLPEDIFEVRSQITGKVEAELNAAFRTITDIENSLDEAYKGVEEVMLGATPVTRAELNNRLYGYLTKDDSFMAEVTERGIQAEDMLPDFIRADAKAMRDQVDKLSEQVADSDFLKQGADIKVMEAINENLGSYLRRKYRLFEDAGFKNTDQFKQAREDAIDMFMDNPGMARDFYSKVYPNSEGAPDELFIGLGSSEKMTREAATNLVDDFTDIRAARKGPTKTDAISRVAVNKLRTDMFKTRSVSNETIRRLLGEIKDPQEAFVSTVADLAEFKATDDFLASLKEGASGTGSGVISEVPRAGYVQLTEEYWGSARNLYVSPAVRKDLTRLVLNDLTAVGNIARDTYSMFLRAKGVTQFGKTVLSPVTQIRNVTSASLFAMAQGNIGKGGKLYESFGYVWDNILRKGDKDRAEFYQMLQRLGVVGNQSQLREIDRLMREGLGTSRELDTINGIPVGPNVGNVFQRATSNKFLSAVGKPLSRARDLYQGGDDVWKIYNFMFEKNKVIRAFGNEAAAKEALGDLDEYAANIVRNTVPNYERVPEIVKGLRKLPVGNFIAFPAEILRTSANTLKQALDELTSTNPQLREIGMRRLTGFTATTVAAPAALQSLAMSLTGVGEEQMEAARRSGPPWSRNHTLIPVSTDEDGNLTGYIDFSYTNPYDYLAAPAKAILNAINDGQDLGKDTGKIAFDAVLGAVGELVAPFGDESILTEKLLDVSTRGGQTRTGARVFRDVDETGTKIYKSFAHIMDAFNPGALELVGSIKPQLKTTQEPGIEPGRLVRGFLSDNVDPAGNERRALTELARALTGVTEIEVKPENVVMYSSFEYGDNTRSARQIFNSSVRTRGALDPQDAIDTYASANEALYRTQSRMYQVIQDMRRLGMKDPEIRRVLRQYKVGNVTQLMRGDFVPMTVSTEVRREVRRNGNNLPMSEINNIRRELRGRKLGGVQQEEPRIEEQAPAPAAPATTTPAPAVQPAPTSNLGTLPVTPAPAAPAAPIADASLLGSNPVEALKNLVIAQRTQR